MLTELNFEKYKGTDNYILAPEIQNKRTRVMADVLTKGFSQYYSQLNTGRHLTFKCLRKAFITSLMLYIPENAKIIIGHSDGSVTHKHYVDILHIVKKVAQGFSVFSNEIERKNDLEEIRSKSEQNQKYLELENEL